MTHETEQHPYDPQSQTYMAHCSVCGIYDHDSWFEPPTDFICDRCIERTDEEADNERALHHHL